MPLLDAGSLHWADVDPSAHPFDPALARTLAANIVDDALVAYASRGGRTVTPAADDAAALTDEERDAVERAVERALVGGYGAWVCGWCWSANEPGGGGMVRGWCCARDSVLPLLEWEGPGSPFVLDDPAKTGTGWSPP